MNAMFRALRLIALLWSVSSAQRYDGLDDYEDRSIASTADRSIKDMVQSVPYLSEVRVQILCCVLYDMRCASVSVCQVAV